MPTSLLVAERTAFVAGFVAVTLAPTIKAPLESYTTPVISPKVWALISAVSPNEIATKATTLNIERTNGFILRSSWILAFLKNHIMVCSLPKSPRGGEKDLKEILAVRMHM